MFYGGIEPIIKTIMMSVLLYFSIVLIIRLSGKRTLGELNAFDMLVTISMGSVASSTILSKDTDYLKGMAAIITLVILQYATTKLTTLSTKLKHIMKAEPTLLFLNGEYLEDNMKKMRITKSDILQQARVSKGVTSNSIKAAVLESNGKLSIITDSKDVDEQELKRYM